MLGGLWFLKGTQDELTWAGIAWFRSLGLTLPYNFHLAFGLLQIRLDCFYSFGFCDMPSHHPWISNSARLRCLQGNWYKVPSRSIWCTRGEENDPITIVWLFWKRYVEPSWCDYCFFGPTKLNATSFFLISLFTIVCYLHDHGVLFAYKFDGVFPCPIDKILTFIRELD